LKGVSEEPNLDGNKTWSSINHSNSLPDTVFLMRMRMVGQGETVVIFNPDDAREMYRYGFLVHNSATRVHLYGKKRLASTNLLSQPHISRLLINLFH